MLILGNRSKHNLVTGLRPMSMETLLQTTVAHSPGFDPAFALGRIHSILSALIQHCKTRAAYLYTGSFTCELHIRPGGYAFVPPVVSDIDAKLELLRMWELVWGKDVPSGALAPRPLRPVVSEHYHLQLAKTAEPLTSLNVVQPIEYPAPVLSRIIVAPFILYIALNICYNIFWKILPIVTLLFQIVFILHFVTFALITSVTICVVVLTLC